MNKVKINQIFYVNFKQREKVFTLEDLKELNKNTQSNKQLIQGFTKIRIITDRDVKMATSKSCINSSLNFFGLKMNLTRKILPVYDAIIYIHGGGFIAISSETQQNFLINWSKSTNSVSFCIDYKLAPQQKYPTIMEECYQAYDFIVENCETIFNFKLGKVVLSGDSAGGLICLNLIKYTISNHKKVPDGLLLYYPCKISLIKAPVYL